MIDCPRVCGFPLFLFSKSLIIYCTNCTLLEGSEEEMIAILSSNGLSRPFVLYSFLPFFSRDNLR